MSENKDLDALLAELDELTAEEVDDDAPIRVAPTDQSPPGSENPLYLHSPSPTCEEGSRVYHRVRQGRPQFRETAPPDPPRETPHQQRQRRERFLARQQQLAQRQRHNRPPTPDQLNVFARDLNRRSHGANLWNTNLIELLERYLGPQMVILLQETIQRHGPLTENDLMELVTSTIDRYFAENPDNPHIHNLYSDLTGVIQNHEHHQRR